MSIDKLFQKIQSQVKDIRKSLDSFEDETIHPSVSDCDKLRSQMNDLQETIAVYKFQKNNKELSPSFNIHAKISEKDPGSDGHVEAKKEKEEIVKSRVHTHKEAVRSFEEVKEAETMLKPLLIGINDKFRFINELFAQNASEYNIVVEQLGTLHNWHETHVYLNSLRDVYGWKENHEVVKYFYAHVKKRFD